MPSNEMQPAQQLLLLMERIYRYGMTTTSGGNLSIRGADGDIWITPSGVDKGALTAEDMVCVQADGSVRGKHKPSSEFPFHRLIYETRPDLRAIVHAHPPALVSFSIVRRIPDTRLLPNERLICGRIGMAPYALPGSEELGRNIAKVFGEGVNSVMLENHGVVVGGQDLFEAFRVFETLDYCARLEIEASRIGRPTLLTDEDYEIVKKSALSLPAHRSEGIDASELEIRRTMCGFIRRAYDQGLFTSTQGTFSQRLNGTDFLITPYGIDRKYLQPEELVRVRNGTSEEGKLPSQSVRFHQAIYEQQKHVDSVILAHPPYIMAFAVTDLPFDSRTIPESYILLRGMPKLSFESLYNEPEETAALFKPNTPIAIVRNNCIVVTGQGLLNTFDRLEVAEYSAKSILSARALGHVAPIEDDEIRDLKQAFKLED
ncbi:class II aldolase/adducin family protein [Cohnella thailandensis]|uniref:Class II aldolase/adducin family protein n=1 Tax=Cohnella thailandensis TaxID=557557 RepID=A0A841T2N7_9BACL|nr:class II aldolase/adducin family protein [Cohnella thailandensis]MBB6638404.1 class II aldolase/adducin family protein [Cohnella thailandensis]MBP1977118.1 L-fuculose-phosphate aldolase [Cohnella thailandensis]